MTGPIQNVLKNGTYQNKISIMGSFDKLHISSLKNGRQIRENLAYEHKLG